MQARQMLERKPPTWASIWSCWTIFSVFCRATAGELASSTMTSSTGRPLTPPFLLMRSTAICRPTTAVLPPSAAAPESGCSEPILKGFSAPNAARHGAGMSIMAPIAPVPQPTKRRRVALPRYQMSSAHFSSFHFSVMASLSLWIHSRAPKRSRPRRWARLRPLTGSWRAADALANAILRAVSTGFACPRQRLVTRKIVALAVFPGSVLMIKWAKCLAARPNGARHDHGHDATTANRRSARSARDRRRGAPAYSARRPCRADQRPRARLRAGQPCHPAASAGRRFHALLPAQPKTVSVDRRLGAGRLAAAGARRGPRYPHRPAALPGVARRRHCGRANRPAALVARRSRGLCHRLLVFLRAGADRGRHRAAPLHLQLHGADVSHHHRNRAGRAVPRPARGLDAADESRRRHPGGADHDAISIGARRAGASRQAGSDRHQRHRQTGLGRPGADRGRRNSD